MSKTVSPLKKMYHNILSDYRKIIFLMHQKKYTLGYTESLYASFFSKANNSIEYIAHYHPEYALEKTSHDKSAKSLTKKFRMLLTASEEKIPVIEYARDIDNVFKHKKITRYDSKINDIEQLKEAICPMIYKDKNGYYGSFVVVMISRISENEVILCNVLAHSVISVIRNILIDIGVISKHKGKFEWPDFYTPRKVAQKKGAPHITMITDLPVGTPVADMGLILFYDKESEFDVRVANEDEKYKCNMQLNINIIEEP